MFTSRPTSLPASDDQLSLKNVFTVHQNIRSSPQYTRLIKFLRAFVWQSTEKDSSSIVYVFMTIRPFTSQLLRNNKKRVSMQINWQKCLICMRRELTVYEAYTSSRTVYINSALSPLHLNRL
jgi:hypothetical protein